MNCAAMHVQLSVYGNKREAEVRRQLSSKGGNEAVMKMQFYFLQRRENELMVASDETNGRTEACTRIK